jgi:hypothetical protein
MSICSYVNSNIPSYKEYHTFKGLSSLKFKMFQLFKPIVSPYYTVRWLVVARLVHTGRFLMVSAVSLSSVYRTGVCSRKFVIRIWVEPYSILQGVGGG